jgi:uncharacterized membrane protein (UPF0127 family)
VQQRAAPAPFEHRPGERAAARDDVTVVAARVPVLALVAALLVACSGASPPARYPVVVRFDTSDGVATLHVRLARTDAERQRGLMGVRHLPDDSGMAFVWKRPTDGAFWMKDTPIPLAIAFVDERGRIGTIREMRPCASDPCPLYAAGAPYVVAIEANAGWFDRHGVGVGDRASVGSA